MLPLRKIRHMSPRINKFPAFHSTNTPSVKCIRMDLYHITKGLVPILRGFSLFRFFLYKTIIPLPPFPFSYLLFFFTCINKDDRKSVVLLNRIIGLFYAITLLELIYASAAINELLTAGVEGVALGADFDLEFALDGAALKGLTAGTANDALAVNRMDVLFHNFLPNMSVTGTFSHIAANSRSCNSIIDATAIIPQEVQ